MPVNASERVFDTVAPDFNLLSVDQNYYSLENLKGKHGTVIVFICNHCPYVIAVAERLSKEAKELNKEGISTIAIMSNDAKQNSADSFENMINFSKKYDFGFQYLYDESQEVAKKYNAVCTPDFFGFDSSLLLKYRGRIDSAVMNKENLKIDRNLYDAMIQIKSEGKAPTEQFNSFGCSIKWKNSV